MVWLIFHQSECQDEEFFRQFSLRFRERLLSVSLSGPSWARVALDFIYATLQFLGDVRTRLSVTSTSSPRLLRGCRHVASPWSGWTGSARTSQGSQSQASIIIVVLTIHLSEERQCDPDLSFLFNVSNTMVTTVERSVACSRLRDSRVRWIEKAQAKRSGTRGPNNSAFQPLSQSRPPLTVPSRFIRSVSLKMLNVGH